MGKLDTAADALVAYVETLRPLTDVADALKGLGSVENAIKERQTALASATTQHEDLKLQVNIENDALKVLRDTKAKEAADADARIQAMTEEATNEAHNIIIAARSVGDATLIEAQARATKVQEDSDKAMLLAREELVKVQEQLAEATATRDQAILDTADAAVKMEEMRTTAQSFAVAPLKSQPIFASTPNQSPAQTAAQDAAVQDQ